MADDIEQRKRSAALRAVELVMDGMALGLGTGSTVAHMLEALAEKVRSGLRVVGVPSSRATEASALRLGIPLATLDQHPVLDLTLDGADEVDPRLDLIKGGGGALLREKILAAASRQLVIMVDDTKLVSRLGERFALPVEVVPFATPTVLRSLARLDLRPTLRQRDGMPTLTDNGNVVIDCQTGPLEDAAGLAAHLRTLPGVVETGLFLGMASMVVIGHGGGRVTVQRHGEPVAW